MAVFNCKKSYFIGLAPPTTQPLCLRKNCLYLRFDFFPVSPCDAINCDEIPKQQYAAYSRNLKQPRRDGMLPSRCRIEETRRRVADFSVQYKLDSVRIRSRLNLAHTKCQPKLRWPKYSNSLFRFQRTRPVFRTKTKKIFARCICEMSEGRRLTFYAAVFTLMHTSKGNPQ
jgi:hypothetical protein